MPFITIHDATISKAVRISLDRIAGYFEPRPGDEAVLPDGCRAILAMDDLWTDGCQISVLETVEQLDELVGLAEALPLQIALRGAWLASVSSFLQPTRLGDNPQDHPRPGHSFTVPVRVPYPGDSDS